MFPAKHPVRGCMVPDGDTATQYQPCDLIIDDQFSGPAIVSFDAVKLEPITVSVHWAGSLGYEDELELYQEGQGQSRNLIL